LGREKRGEQAVSLSLSLSKVLLDSGDRGRIDSPLHFLGAREERESRAIDGPAKSVTYVAEKKKRKKTTSA
jgi:hypothetical protein